MTGAAREPAGDAVTCTSTVVVDVRRPRITKSAYAAATVADAREGEEAW